MQFKLVSFAQLVPIPLHPSIMGRYDFEVKRKLTKDVVDIILRNVRCYNITRQKMKDLAFVLGKNVGGRHLRRMDSGGESDCAEMRSILSDWWDVGDLCKNTVTKDSAVQRLTEAFKSETLQLKPLAGDLEKIRTAERNVRI